MKGGEGKPDPSALLLGQTSWLSWPPCPRDGGLEPDSGIEVLPGTISHHIPTPTPHSGRAGDGDGAGRSQGPWRLLLVLLLASGHLEQRRRWFLPLRGPLSTSQSAMMGKNPGDVPMEMHLPLLLRQESRLPRTTKPSLPEEGSGNEGGRAQPQALLTVWEARWIDSSCALPELSSCSVPHPHCPAHITATITRDCSITEPIELWVPSPGGDTGWAVQQSLVTRGPLFSSPYQICLQGPTSWGPSTTSKDLSDSRQEAHQDEGTGNENCLQERPHSGPEQPSPPPSSPTSNPGMAGWPHNTFARTPKGNHSSLVGALSSGLLSYHTVPRSHPSHRGEPAGFPRLESPPPNPDRAPGMDQVNSKTCPPPFALHPALLWVKGGQGSPLHSPPTRTHIPPSSPRVESSEDPSLADPSALKPAKARFSACQSKIFQLPASSFTSSPPYTCTETLPSFSSKNTRASLPHIWTQRPPSMTTGCLHLRVGTLRFTGAPISLIMLDPPSNPGSSCSCVCFTNGERKLQRGAECQFSNSFSKAPSTPPHRNSRPTLPPNEGSGCEWYHRPKMEAWEAAEAEPGWAPHPPPQPLLWRERDGEGSEEEQVRGGRDIGRNAPSCRDAPSPARRSVETEAELLRLGGERKLTWWVPVIPGLRCEPKGTCWDWLLEMGEEPRQRAGTHCIEATSGDWRVVCELCHHCCVEAGLKAESIPQGPATS
ncbi:hypothetical protein Cadr_000003132 [Camelus dromedarius]|uniref:Uncharacterized protein n=1 Tax=Camelus dromedarius TaxID=9838 RepID=A0A5N4C2Q9_CAMDR|nr:hypothetical protein Cadr_000003132 [Camelus dromedarius]